MEVVAPIFQESAFVWLCTSLAGACFIVAVAVRARHFLRELSAQFIGLPPTSKAVLVAAVVAQKPTSVSTNQHESARAEVTMPAAPNTENLEERRRGEGEDGFDKIDRISEADASDSSNPVNPVKETPCLPSSADSVLSENKPLVVHPSVNAQLELFSNGDLIARSNDVERVYRRVNADGDLTDNPAFGWEDGWITWEVPFGWTSAELAKADENAIPMKVFDPQAGHRFEITPSGLVTVRKFGNSAQSEADGRMYCNGIEWRKDE